MRIILICFISLLGGCAYEKRVKHLSDTEFDHYYALRVFMEEDARKSYLKMETEEERNAFLKSENLWDTFYQYEPHIRSLVVEGDVQVGWQKPMVYMAWGRPYASQKIPGRQAERSVMWIYRFEVDPDGVVRVWEKSSKTAYKATRLFTREIILDDDIVADIQEKVGAW